MFKKWIVIVMAANVLLCGCQVKVENSESTDKQIIAETSIVAANGEVESADEPEDESEDDLKESHDTVIEVLSQMDALSFDASDSEFVEAYKADYRRAAATMGISANHDWVYEEEPVYIGDGLMLTSRMSPGSKMIMYDGFAESEEWIYQEVQLALMAADQSLTSEMAEQYVVEIWEEAWEKRDIMPSMVAKNLPNGILYSFSIKEQNLFALRIGYYKVR
ncbi:MAG: hypothetical protein ACRDBO_09510 [Lachnospiraceae bacterium]